MFWWYLDTRSDLGIMCVEGLGPNAGPSRESTHMWLLVLCSCVLEGLRYVFVKKGYVIIIGPGRISFPSTTSTPSVEFDHSNCNGYYRIQAPVYHKHIKFGI